MAQKRLVILDLNGTILHRLTHAPESKLFRNHPKVLEKKLLTDITIHGSKVVFRPHVRTFLSSALRDFDVAIWTSSRPKNSLPMIYHSFTDLLDFSAILKEAKKHAVTTRQILLGPSDSEADRLGLKVLTSTSGKANLKFIWTQDDCDIMENTCDDKIPTSTSNENNFVKPIMKKDLRKVYKAFPEYSPANTLIIDDSNEKLADHPENHLEIDEFNVLDYSKDFTLDNSLLKLTQFLKKMVQDDPSDLRNFLAANNFKDF